MAKKKPGIVDPTRLESFDKDKNVQVIVETPKGSRNKYAWDTEQQVFALKKVLPEGMVFPHDFGFIPSTEGEDGDPNRCAYFDGPVCFYRMPGKVTADRRYRRRADPKRQDGAQ